MEWLPADRADRAWIEECGKNTKVYVVQGDKAILSIRIVRYVFVLNDSANATASATQSHRHHAVEAPVLKQAASGFHVN
jgi:hypothetical protein